MTSASTLIRRAAKAKPAQAKKLRAEAAKLRRAARARKKPGPNPATTAIGADPKANRAANALGTQGGLRGDNSTDMNFAQRSAAQGWQPAPLVSTERAEALMKLARHKGTDVGNIHHELCRIAANAGHEARQEADQRHIETLKHIHEANAINVVCAFVATANAMAKANRGPMPETVIVSGFQLARVVDALEKAGYSADGLKSMSRGALEARLNR